MRGGKRAVAGRMTVLGQHQVAEAAGEAIDVGDDLVAVGNGELSARTEVVLDVDNEQDVAVCDCGRHGRTRGGASCRPSAASAHSPAVANNIVSWRSRRKALAARQVCPACLYRCAMRPSTSTARRRSISLTSTG